MNNPITRFAPSPSGLLHVGNVRTALLNYLVSKKDNGHFILRIDDTDTERSKDKFINNIQQDLNWLGLNYDEYYQQSERIKLYDEAFELLKNKELVYPCFETPDELDKKRKRLIARRMPPVYDRAALKHTKDEIDSFLESGKKPHWRFKLSNKKITFDDLIQKYSIKSIDKLQIDVEGAEYKIMNSINFQKIEINKILFESKQTSPIPDSNKFSPFENAILRDLLKI